MGLLHKKVTFLNFDGTYDFQNQLTGAFPHRWVEWRSLRGTSLYCSPDALAAIKRKLKAIPEKGITFLGSGNYHYAAFALLQELKKPFTLVLFDHHTDLDEGRLGPLLSCGSWVHHALTDIDNLSKVIIIGPDKPADALPVPIRRRVRIIPDRSLPAPGWISAQIPTAKVHISIDKDVLDPAFAKTNWDQGRLSLETLKRMLAALLIQKDVDGVDICGEWPIGPHDHLHSEIRQIIEKNQRANLALARTLLQKKSRRPASGSCVK